MRIIFDQVVYNVRVIRYVKDGKTFEKVGKRKAVRI